MRHGSFGEFYTMKAQFLKRNKILLTGNKDFKYLWASMGLNSMVVIIKGYALVPPTSPSIFNVAYVSRLSGSEISYVRHGSAYSSSLLVSPSSEQGSSDCGF
jgi:CDP-glucose 4,6-dehydratase